MDRQKIALSILLAIMLIAPITQVHADESMGSIHIYGTGSVDSPSGSRYLCPTIIYPMGSVRFDSNVTVKDSSGVSGQYAVEFDVSDINHGYFLQSLAIEKNGTHLFIVNLYKDGVLVNNQTMPIHGNSADNFTLPQRKFTAFLPLGDFLNFNLVPFNTRTQTLALQWYGIDPPFNNGKFIIVGGANALIPANFTATSETMLFVGVPGTVANFTSLNAYIQLTQEETALNVPLSYYQSFGKAGPCGNMVSSLSSNACEQVLSDGITDISIRMTKD